MSRTLSLVALACLFHAVVAFSPTTCAATAPAPIQFASAQGVDTAKHHGHTGGTPAWGGAVQLARRWDAVGRFAFDRGLAGWQVRNFEDALTIGVVDATGGGRCLLVTRQKGKTDTAFELTSPSIAVPPRANCRLVIVAQHNVDLRHAHGHKAFYWMRVRWLAADGQEVGVTPFALGAEDESWYECVVDAVSPATAAKAVVHIGFDHPNLYSGSYLGLRSLALTIRRDPTRYVAEGTLLSRLLRLDAADHLPTLAWQADTPPGTTVKFQVRTAPDVHGAPGAWTPLCGPDGTTASFYTTSGTPLPPAHRGHRWLQYRVVLATRDDTATPILRQVRLAAGQQAVTDQVWTAPDTAPPVLASYSPRRTTRADAPIEFALADNRGGVGLDPRSVQVYLDGQSLTSRLTRLANGSFRINLPAPLSPGRGLHGFGDWSIANFQGALTIRQGEPRRPNSPRSLVITRRGPERDTAFAIVSPKVSVQAGASYRLSYWSRHTMSLDKAGATSSRYRCGIEWFDTAGKTIGKPVPLHLGEANPAWHHDVSTHTAPKGAAWAEVRFGWDFPNLFGGAEVALAEPTLDGPHPVQNKRANLHRVTLRASDLVGNTLCRDWWILVKEQPKEGIVTMRDDGIVLVDGKPFFPIGIYSVWKREHNQHDFDKAFAELAAAGFNTAHTYNSARTPDFEEFYAAAHRHGIKLFVACRAGANNRRPQTTANDVAAEANRPALLAWYLADDTASHITPDALRRIHNAVHDIDPHHITVQADAVGAPDRSRYAAFVDSTDGFLPELYPIRSNTRDEVATIIRDMKTIAADLARAGRRKPVWAIVQDFEGWGWERYPTAAEVRAMTYLSIIHGATGMTYYTYGGSGKNHGAPHDPKVWATLKTIAGELAKLHAVLVERDPPQTQRVQILAGRRTDGLGYPSISTRLKRRGGRTYLLAANSAEAPVRARLTLDGVGKAVDVMFEGRTVQARNGAFDDAFAPYAVHVYAW